ncbi:D-glycero-beta-D-manno-heptose-7-phosphate kinase [Lachnospira multipara]|uniref:D-glycero-beta-D-manno-heptose-7-phosphate kinase n=1 Tax=Lachnospira multipara TaxID=28051 RepID=UPI0003F72274|nr:D-glycero-beta-D-manno-heptose-7-phosphate kinase [Lachnospira multipara]
MIEQIEKIKDITVLIYGDMMVDKYVNGTVSRISPEAPVPVLTVTDKFSKLGGAGNVIDNIVSLGASVKVIGYLGNDMEGDWAKKALTERGVDTSLLLQYEDCRTITKTRLTSKKQQFLRADEEIIKPAPKEYFDYMKRNVDKLFDGVQVAIVSDYGKGAVTEETAQLIISEAIKRNIPVFVDPKGKDYTKYKGATVCTPNMNEIRLVSGEKLETEDELRKTGEKLRKELKIDNFAVTRSEKGITLFEEGQINDFPAISKDVIDVSGAGDTVVATMACLYGCGIDLQKCCKLANLAASVVCSKFGTATLSLNELMEQIANSRQFKYVTLQNAKYIVDSLKEKGKKIVFTNGCFDMLHAGHLSSFMQAKEYGDILIVAVNSDRSVKANKGDERPIISEKYRIEMLCALEVVDYVVLMDEDNPINIISTLQPDITVKGKDWENKELPERKVVEGYGGCVKFIEMKGTLSTTNIIKKIRNE